MIGRRQFIRSAALASGVGFLSKGSAFSAAHPPGYAPTVGLQMYTVRGLLEKDFEGTLRKVADLGIKEVEFDKYFGKKPEEVRRLIDDAGIKSFSKHIDTATLREGLDEACDGANAVGQNFLVLGWLPPEERRSLDDYKKLIEELNRGADLCKKHGILLGYHNHGFEFEKIEGKMPYHLIVMNTGDLVLELDVYWATKAGLDPLKMLKAHPGRFQLLHLKDMDEARNFSELGGGTIDFSSILKAAQDSGVRHAYIEQDETPGDPFDSVKMSLEHLRSIS